MLLRLCSFNAVIFSFIKPETELVVLISWTG
uniref:Uncharacterized protein n=1 Tax=Anguilla anguilla TaxID=7936 RepID=A0A0E9SNC7_ANGAN